MSTWRMTVLRRTAPGWGRTGGGTGSNLVWTAQRALGTDACGRVSTNTNWWCGVAASRQKASHPHSHRMRCAGGLLWATPPRPCPSRAVVERRALRHLPPAKGLGAWTHWEEAFPRDNHLPIQTPWP